MPRKQPRKSPLVPRSLDSPVLRLSEGAQARLEELILEGDLLEVSMDESLHLWRILQATQSPPGDGTALGLFQTVGREGKPVKARARDKDQLDKKRKRKLEKGELTFGGDAAPRDILKADKPKKKKLKAVGDGKRDEPKAERRGVERADKKDKKRAKQRKMKEGAGAAKERKAKAGGRKATSRDDDSDDEYAVCAAEDCQRPCGDEVNWVQCDGGCDGWFHQVCVGVSTEMAEKEDYICLRCTRRRPIHAAQSTG